MERHSEFISPSWIYMLDPSEAASLPGWSLGPMVSPHLRAGISYLWDVQAPQKDRRTITSWIEDVLV
jgi:hypothetical protein